MNFERPIEILDIKSDTSSLSTRWVKWLKSLNFYLLATNITNAERKKAMLLYLAGSDTQELYDTLTAYDDETKMNVYEVLVSRLNAYFSPKRNNTYERHIFRQISQKEGESLDLFCTRLKTQAQYWNFRDQLEDNIKDQVVDKCLNNSLRVKILEKGDEFSLEDLLKLARSMELSEKQAREITNSFKTENASSKYTEQINKIDNKRPNIRPSNSGQPKSNQYTTRSSHTRHCCRCNGIDHLARDEKCPARYSTCSKCKFKGHLAVCCKSQGNRANVVQIDDDGLGDIDRNYAFTLCEKGLMNMVTCNVGGVDLEMIVDSGASVNVIDKTTWKDLKAENIKCKSVRILEKLYPYGGAEPLNVIGKFAAQCKVHSNDKPMELDFLVFDGTGKPLLGNYSAQKLGAISVNVNSVSSSNDFHKLAKELSLTPADVEALTNGVGKVKDFEIDLYIDNSVAPVAQRLRPIPYALRNKVDEAVNQLLEMDIIENVKTPSDWISPIRRSFYIFDDIHL